MPAPREEPMTPHESPHLPPTPSPDTALLSNPSQAPTRDRTPDGKPPDPQLAQPLPQKQESGAQVTAPAWGPLVLWSPCLASQESWVLSGWVGLLGERWTAVTQTTTILDTLQQGQCREVPHGSSHPGSLLPRPGLEVGFETARPQKQGP